MNLARMFSYTRELESQREQLQERVRELESKQDKLIDAFALAAHKSPVFDRPVSQKESEVPALAFGPTAVGIRRAMLDKEQNGHSDHTEEIIRRAEQARTPPIPELPTQ